LFALTLGLAASKILKKYIFRITAIGAIIGIIVGVLILQMLSLPQMSAQDAVRIVTYFIMLISGSVVFSWFWTATSGMDAHTISEQFKASSIMIPGFRHDPRIVEKMLARYIPALTVLGGAFVGLLAGFADLTSAIGTGTGILLTVMIVHQLYEQIMSQHYDELPPIVKKFAGE